MSHSETQAGAPPLSSPPSPYRSRFNGAGELAAAAAVNPYWRSSLLTPSLLVICTNTMVGAAEGGEKRMRDGHEMWNKKE